MKRVCYACEEQTTKKILKYKDKRYVVDMWYSNHGTDLYLCHHCYNYILRKEYRKRNLQSRIIFKRQRFHNGTKILRVGVCNYCRAVVPFDCKRTNLHHEEYDEKNPFKHTIELCPKCHLNRAHVNPQKRRLVVQSA